MNDYSKAHEVHQDALQLNPNNTQLLQTVSASLQRMESQMIDVDSVPSPPKPKLPKSKRKINGPNKRRKIIK